MKEFKSDKSMNENELHEGRNKIRNKVYSKKKNKKNKNNKNKENDFESSSDSSS
jgi:hypothetical protein